MGCWNATCGFSQQSILHGEQVVAFIILNNETTYHSCYSNSVALPMAFPIFAEYNDYGSIENAKTGFSTESTIALFNRYYKEEKLILNERFIDDMKNRSHEPNGFNEADGFTDVESIFYGIERGYLTLSQNNYGGGGKVEHGLGFILIKKDVMLSAWETTNYCDDWETKTSSFDIYKADIQILIDEILSADFDAIEKMKQRIEEMDLTQEESIEEAKKIFKLEWALQENWGGDKLESTADRWGNACKILTSYDMVHTDSFRKLFDITKELYNKEMEDELKDVISQFLMTISSFNLFRKSWSPQGNTSQHDNFDVTIDYMERVLRRLYAERRIRNEEGYYEHGVPEIVGQLSIFEEGKII